MKILFDATAISLPLSGIGRYALELSRYLPSEPGIAGVRYLQGKQVVSDIDLENLSPPQSSGAARRWLKPLLPYRLVLGPYRRYRARALALSLRSYEDYLYYSPNFSIPPLSGKSVVTLHDLSVFHFPEFHPRDRVNYLRDQINNSVERADRLVTDSLFVRDELLHLFPLPPQQVTAIPLGLDAAFRPHASEELAVIMAQYKLRPGGYLLSVGTIEPRKNLAGLLQAYSLLAPALRKQYPLVIAGAYGWNSGPLMEQVRQLGQSGEVIYLDYVPEQHLPGLYAGAALFAYLSFYEGFGLPVLEAMGSGVPVVCAASSALPDLCDGSALQVDPHDIPAMAVALQRGLEDEAWRLAAVEQGLARSAAFCWQRTTAALVDVFREVAE